MNWEKRLAPIIFRISDPHFSKQKIVQDFSIPENILFYISKNVSSPKLYRKLSKICKYFPENHKIFFLHCLSYKLEYGGFYTCPQLKGSYHCGASISNGKAENQLKNIYDIPQIIWVENILSIDCKNSDNLLSNLIPKLKCTAKFIHLDNTTITMKEFRLICQYAEKCHLRDDSKIDDDNGQHISQPKILKEMPKLLEYSACDVPDFSADHLREILESPNLKNFEDFAIWGLTDIFDVDEAFTYLKKNKTLKVRLTFDSNKIAEECRKKVDVITLKILKEKKRQYFPPYLFCPANRWTSDSPNCRLRDLHESYKVKRKHRNRQ